MKTLPLALLFLFVTACSSLKPTTKNDVFPGQARLPQEEAPHLKNSLEWWYLTGHLTDVHTGETYGVEYVFFHFSPDGKKDYQMVNFALSDPQEQRFRYDYDLGQLPTPLTATLPLGLTETKADQTWALSGQEGNYHLRARMTNPTGKVPGAAIDLRTTPTRAAVLHGDGTGYEQYDPVAQAGYYSYPHLSTTGTVEIDGQPHTVAGELWYDRQWNCGGVNQRHVAWDWMSLQLDLPSGGAGEDLMLYTVHDTKTGQHIGGGTLAGGAGENLHLNEADFTMTPLTYWTSPDAKKKYPATWHLTVPAQGYDLTVEPLLPNQELSLRLFKVLTLRYWEGMCRVSGTHHGQPVTGRAYVEITNR